MFSTSVEVVLHIAFREAVSRRHAYLTLEHLLYAVAHDPDGERILAACGGDLPLLRRSVSESLDESVEALPGGQEREPEQTTAFRRALQAAVLHVQSAQRQEAQVGDVIAAILQQPQTRAAALLAEQGITRLDVLEYLAHGITKTPIHHDDGSASDTGDSRDGMAGNGDPGSGTAKDPLAAYCMNLTARARHGLLDPLIGRAEELSPDVRHELDLGARQTAGNTGMQFNIALNYGGRAEIVDAARRAIRSGIAADDLDERRFGEFLYTSGQPDPDLLIRTSGEMRVSNFLLWQIAYAEIWVTETLWPDFRRRHLLEAVIAYQKRDRRYGGIKPSPVALGVK